MQNFPATPYPPSTLRGRMLQWLSRWGRRLWRSFCFPFQSQRGQVSHTAAIDQALPSRRGPVQSQRPVAAPLEDGSLIRPVKALETELNPKAEQPTEQTFEEHVARFTNPTSDSLDKAEAGDWVTAENGDAAAQAPLPSRTKRTLRKPSRPRVVKGETSTVDVPFDWVLENRLAIGPLPQKAWIAAFEEQGINSIVSLCDEAEGRVPKVMTQQFRCVRVSLPDSRYQRVLTVAELEEAVDLIHWHIQKRQTVYLHCLAGVERSPLVAIAYLARYRAMDLLDAVGWLSHVREKSRPTPAQLKVVRQYLRET